MAKLLNSGWFTASGRKLFSSSGEVRRGIWTEETRVTTIPADPEAAIPTIQRTATVIYQETISETNPAETSAIKQVEEKYNWLNTVKTVNRVVGWLK